MPSHKINLVAIADFLDRLPGNGNYWLAFSGGLDSSVLLHILSELQKKIRPINLTAIHINHKISDNSDAWMKHCERTCHELNTRFISESIDVSGHSKHGREAYARELRYRTIHQFMEENDVLLTAHHQDDQIETLLLRLFRGTGIDGLAGMPRYRRFYTGWLARPLLDTSKKTLRNYAVNHHIAWVDDESNQDPSYDRNYVRGYILPVIEQRWSSAKTSILRVQRNLSETSRLLKEIAQNDLQDILGPSLLTITLSDLVKISPARQKNVLRYWIKKNNFDMPTEAILETIINDLVLARKDAQPYIKWKDTELRRYRDLLYLGRTFTTDPINGVYKWSLGKILSIGNLRLQAVKTRGEGIRSSAIPGDVVEVKFRQGGERIRPEGRKESHKLKTLLQEAGIPPWERHHIPLIYYGDKLIAVGCLWTAEDAAAGPNEMAWKFHIIKQPQGSEQSKYESE